MGKTCKVKKDACTICFDTVTKKNGVQCQGACKKWFHFRCLHYTPGKVKDIRAGTIKIMCPCPDCTSGPQEVLVNPPYTCMNQKCPANAPRKCESYDCPHNSSPCSKELCSKAVAFEKSQTPPCDHSQQYGALSPRRLHSLSDQQQQKPTCPSGLCEGQVAMEDIGQLLHTNTSSCSFDQPTKAKSQSCCYISKGTGTSPPVASLSDSRILFENTKLGNESMENALEQMCATVGLLSNQIRNLMCKLVKRAQ